VPFTEINKESVNKDNDSIKQIAYVYRTTENPSALLTMIANKTLESARKVLINKYGSRLISVEPMITKFKE
jgi:hypothetical protein